ncbi:transmembrane protein 135-like isoform X2 [Ornithodoros turicata]|uniref:transmembrane protein 135-like isoform X2 n=1 Tax=Ornithodoros turicata TaxID=34597 RepID=UPI0031398976
MAVFSKLAEMMQYEMHYNCYEIGHTWTPHCAEASVLVGLNAFMESLKIYVPLYTASLIYSGRYNRQGFRQTLQSILASSFFLSFNAFSFIGVYCVLRKYFGRYNMMNSTYLPGFISSFMAILLERKSRRQALAIYVCNIASETIYRILASRQVVRAVKYGEVYMFCLTTAFYMLLLKSHGYSRDPVSKLFQFLVGNCEGKAAPYGAKESMCESSLEDIRPANVGSQVLTRNASNPSFTIWSRHPACIHKENCSTYSFRGFLRPFLVGYAVRAVLRVVSSYKLIARKPLVLLRALLKPDNLRVALFLGCFGGFYRGSSCLLRWITGSNQDWHALPAGLVAGSSMFFYPSPSMALYLLWKLVEHTYLLGIEKKGFPTVPGASVWLYSLSCSVIFYAMWRSWLKQVLGTHFPLHGASHKGVVIP